MTAKELLRMNAPKLREEALKIPDAVGVTAMKKEALVELLARHHHIVLEQKSHSAEKAEIKKHIRAMKVKRNEATAQKAYGELASLRRGIRTLKRRTRTLARQEKMQPPPDAAPQTESAPAAPQAETAS